MRSRASTGDGARVLLLTGAGRGFCAGQDLSDRAVAPDAAPVDLGESIERNYRPLILGLRELPMPVVCAVNGVAAGAGANIALACDLVIAAKSASFIQAFSRIGLVPDSGGTYFLPRLVGTARAMALALLARSSRPRRPQQWGLIYKCVEDAQLASTVDALLAQLAKGPTKGFASIKRALYAPDQGLARGARPRARPAARVRILGGLSRRRGRIHGQARAQLHRSLGASRMAALASGSEVGVIGAGAMGAGIARGRGTCRASRASVRCAHRRRGNREASHRRRAAQARGARARSRPRRPKRPSRGSCRSTRWATWRMRRSSWRRSSRTSRSSARSSASSRSWWRRIRSSPPTRRRFPSPPSRPGLRIPGAWSACTSSIRRPSCRSWRS